MVVVMDVDDVCSFISNSSLEFYFYLISGIFEASKTSPSAKHGGQNGAI